MPVMVIPSAKCLLTSTTTTTFSGMFSVDEPTAAAIRQAYQVGGDLAGIVEFKRHFPLIADHARALECVRAIAGWRPIQAAAGKGGPG